MDGRDQGLAARDAVRSLFGRDQMQPRLKFRPHAIGHIEAQPRIGLGLVYGKQQAWGKRDVVIVVGLSELVGIVYGGVLGIQIHASLRAAKHLPAQAAEHFLQVLLCASQAVAPL